MPRRDGPRLTVSRTREWPGASSLAERLVEGGGGSIRAILLYGSRLLATNPDSHSAFDLVVIVNDNRRFLSALSAAGELHRPLGLLVALSRTLAPNVLAFAPNDGRDGVAKCLVVSEGDFERGLGSHPPDHFLLGRMVQKLGIVWIADASVEAWLEEQVSGAHRRVLEWMAPYLQGPVDAEGLGRRLLEVCYQGEIRPESRDRAGRVFEAQADHFAVALAPALEAAVESGAMTRQGPLYSLRGPVPPTQRRRWARHFRRSKARTTTRWFKHMITFANWLPYVVQKVERHTGRTIELTPLERSIPLIFLWPRVIHVLLSRPRREIDS